jgi:hypothetical protein
MVPSGTLYQEREDEMESKEETGKFTNQEDRPGVDRRDFIKGAVTAAGLLGAVGMTPIMGHSEGAQQQEGETFEQLRRDMMAGIGDDVKKDLQLIAQQPIEIPTPAGARPGAMLDGRFSVYYKDAVPNAMELLTNYFAAFCDRDMASVVDTLHFPYATYETYEPIVYRTQKEFLESPPPSIHESSAPDSQLRPGTYDILDVLQVHTFNPVNVGLELCYTRYRADGFRIGKNQGIYAITNNDGKWGIQLSSVIFTPAEYEHDQLHYDVNEQFLRWGRTAMAAFADRDYDLLKHLGWGAGRFERPEKTASIAGSPGATSFFLSAWAGKPTEAYNTKGRKSRLAVRGFPDSDAINALSEPNDPVSRYERQAQLGLTNIETKDGKPGWFFEMAGGRVGLYGYTKNLADARVLHIGPEKAHTLGGYIRYTPDNVFISETRSLGILVLDKKTNIWMNGGGFGQMMRRDRSNDARSDELLPIAG